MTAGNALRHPQRFAGPSRQPGAARAQAVRARHRLHRQGRQDHHHRRVHRPNDGGSALLRGAASGARGQGRRHRPEREPDARLDHFPELFPALSQARRHDRHGDDRSRRNSATSTSSKSSRSRPTSRCVREDTDDEVYRTAREKYDAILQHVLECRERQQPVLVGTVSIEKSEALSTLFKKHKVPHNVLNARYHEQEAHIIAQAGRPGAVTIATNMAGPRHRHSARRQSRNAAARPIWRRSQDPARTRSAGGRDPRGDRDRARSGGAGRRALCRRQRAAREPAHRQSAAGPLRADKATPAPRNSSSRSKTI